MTVEYISCAKNEVKSDIFNEGLDYNRSGVSHTYLTIFKYRKLMQKLIFSISNLPTREKLKMGSQIPLQEVGRQHFETQHRYW